MCPAPRWISIIAPYLLFLAASVQMVGYLLDDRKIEHVGWHLGLSPCPIVFGADNAEYAIWSTDYHVTYEFDDGSREALVFDSELFDKLPGNHWVHMALINPVAFGPVMPRFYAEPARRALYEGGFLYMMMGYSKKVSSVTVVNKSKTRGLEFEETYTF